jgi:hypothetical protein
MAREVTTLRLSDWGRMDVFGPRHSGGKQIWREFPLPLLFVSPFIALGIGTIRNLGVAAAI